MEKPLENIKNIQASLQQMKARLQSLSRTQMKNIENIEKTFTSSISIMRNKFQDCKKEERKSEEKAMKDVLNNSKICTLKQQKFIQEKELTRSREILTKMKFSESQQIKTMSKKNDQLIGLIKKHHVEENQRRTLQVKQNRQKSRQKINQFHKLKKFQLKKERENEQKQNKIKAIKLAKKVNYLSVQEEKVLDRYKQSSDVLQKLRFAVRKMEKMPIHQFTRLKQRLGIFHNEELTEQAAEKLLNEIVTSQSPDNSRISYE